MTYGENAPEYEYTVEGAVNNDEVVTGEATFTVKDNSTTVTVGPTSNAGIYTIDVSGLTVNSNYEVTYNPGELTINPVVIFNANGGTGSMANEKATYNTSTTLTENAFTKNGATFKEWNTSADGSGTTYQDKASVTITENLTLYAQWEIEEYTITYNLDGGSVNGTNRETYTIETDTFTLINPTKNNYVFAGWTGTDLTDATTTVTIEKGSTGNRTYTATWREKDVNFTVNSTIINENTEHQNAGKIAYGDVIQLKITITNNGLDASDPITLSDSLLAETVNDVKSLELLTEGTTEGAEAILTGNYVIDSVPGKDGDTPGVKEVIIRLKVVGGVPDPIKSQTTVDQGNGKTTQTDLISTTIETNVSFIQKTPKTEGYNVIVVLDESGSMGYRNGDSRYPIDKFINAKTATKAFLDMMFPSATDNTNNSKVAIYTFGTGLHGNKGAYAYPVGSVAGNMSESNALKTAIGNNLSDHPYNSGTPYGQGLNAAYQTLFGADGNGGLAKANPNNHNIVIFLTDGEPSDTEEDVYERVCDFVIFGCHDEFKSYGYKHYADLIKNKGGVIYSIGFDIPKSNETDSAYQRLVRISQTTGFASIAPNDPNELTNVFAFIKAAFENPTNKWSEVGVTEMSSTLLIDNDHPLNIKVNGAPFRTYTDTSFGNEHYIYFDEITNKYDVDATQFTKGANIEVIYYVPTTDGQNSTNQTRTNLKLQSFSGPMSDELLKSQELNDGVVKENIPLNEESIVQEEIKLEDVSQEEVIIEKDVELDKVQAPSESVVIEETETIKEDTTEVENKTDEMSIEEIVEDETTETVEEKTVEVESNDETIEQEEKTTVETNSIEEKTTTEEETKEKSLENKAVEEALQNTEKALEVADKIVEEEKTVNDEEETTEIQTESVEETENVEEVEKNNTVETIVEVEEVEKNNTVETIVEVEEVLDNSNESVDSE